jgi:hypothetical protein
MTGRKRPLIALFPIIRDRGIRTYLDFCLQNIVVFIEGISVCGGRRPGNREEKGGRRTIKYDGEVRNNC